MPWQVPLPFGTFTYAVLSHACVTKLSYLSVASFTLDMFSYAIWLSVLTLTALPTIVHAHTLVGLEARGSWNSSEDDVPKLGAVASESAVCSHIGTGLLEEGGNAADAVCAHE